MTDNETTSLIDKIKAIRSRVGERLKLSRGLMHEDAAKLDRELALDAAWLLALLDGAARAQEALLGEVERSASLALNLFDVDQPRVRAILASIKELAQKGT